MRDRDDYYADYDMPDAYERPLTRREKKERKKLARQERELRRRQAILEEKHRAAAEKEAAEDKSVCERLTAIESDVRQIKEKLDRDYNRLNDMERWKLSVQRLAADSLEERERVAGISAAITQNHPEGIKGAQATAAAIFLARTGKTKEEIRDYIEKTYGYDLHKSWEYWHPIYDWEDSCQGTVPPAMIAFLDSENFEDAIRKAVSLGGDSDTLACITGGIAEAFYKELPAEMVERTMKPFPIAFNKILDAVRSETVYGRTVRIV